MTTLATLTVKVIGDTTDLESKVSKTSSFIDSAAAKMRQAGTVLSATITAPLALMGIKAVDAASDLDESMNKVKVVFENTSESVINFSKTSDQSLGLSQQKALEAAGTFGNLFDAMGVGETVGTDMSTSLVQLAADLASFNNIDPTEALEKLRSGIVGETEPMRQLGVNLAETAVQQKAFEMGLGETADELTFQDKVLARYALMMEQTKNAQGDFARTSDGFANSQRIVKAQLENVAATIGQILLPYAKKLLDWVQDGIKWFQRLSPEGQRLAVIIAVVAAAVGPLLLFLGFLIPAISAVAGVIGTLISVAFSPLGLVIGLIIGLVALLYLAWTNNWGGIQEKTAVVIEYIKGIIAAFIETVRAWWDAHGAEVLATINNLWTLAQEIFRAALEFITSNVSAALEFIRAWWSQHGEAVMTIVNAFWNLIKTVVNAGITFIRNLITTVLDFLKAFWQRHGEEITARFTAVWEMLKTIVKNGMEFIGQIIDAIAAAIKGDWTAFGEHLGNAARIAWDSIKLIFTTAKDNLISTVRILIAEIQRVWNSIDWGQLGKTVVDALIKAILSGLARIIAAAKRVAQAAIDAVKGVFKAKSPSRAFMEIGENAIKGLLIPFEDRDKTKTTVRRLASTLTDFPAIEGNQTTDSSQNRSVENHYYLNTTTKYEPEESIIDKLRILQLSLT